MLPADWENLQSVKAMKATEGVTVNTFDCVSMEEPKNEISQTKKTARNNWNRKGAGNGSFVFYSWDRSNLLCQDYS